MPFPAFRASWPVLAISILTLVPACLGHVPERPAAKDPAHARAPEGDWKAPPDLLTHEVFVPGSEAKGGGHHHHHKKSAADVAADTGPAEATDPAPMDHSQHGAGPQ